MTKVEFIESYIKVEDGDYQWSDNHGFLTRCKDCLHWKHYSGEYCRFDYCDMTDNHVSEDDYCSWG